MSQELKQEIATYIQNTRWVQLATVREDGTPVVRSLGSFAPASADVVYIATNQATEKNKHIAANPRVSLFFQQEGQTPPAFRNVSLVGEATVATGEERQQAIALLVARTPFIRAKAEKNELGDTVVYRVAAKEIKHLDFTRGAGPAAVKVLKV
ncbi:MAG: pyridoxamine 5'-phosphate oxidase family protein [Opitutaceae bacterium]